MVVSLRQPGNPRKPPERTGLKAVKRDLPENAL